MDTADFLSTYRVYYEDTDAGGVVYHANYLRFFERARTDWLRSLGVYHTQLRNEDQVILVLHSLSINYLSPALLDDELHVSVSLISMTRASFIINQTLSRVSDSKPIATLINVKVACLNSLTMKPTRLPQSLVTIINKMGKPT